MLNARVNSNFSPRQRATTDLRRLAASLRETRDPDSSGPPSLRLDLFESHGQPWVTLSSPGRDPASVDFEKVLWIRNQIAAIEEVRGEPIEVLWGGAHSKKVLHPDSVLTRDLTSSDEGALREYRDRLKGLPDEALREERRDHALGILVASPDPALASARYKLARAESSWREVARSVGEVTPMTHDRRKPTEQERQALKSLSQLQQQLARDPRGVQISRLRLAREGALNMVEVELATTAQPRRSSSAPRVLLDTIGALTTIAEVRGVQVRLFRVQDGDPSTRTELLAPSLHSLELTPLQDRQLSSYRNRLATMTQSELELEFGQRVEALLTRAQGDALPIWETAAVIASQGVLEALRTKAKVAVGANS